MGARDSPDGVVGDFGKFRIWAYTICLNFVVGDFGSSAFGAYSICLNFVAGDFAGTE